MLDKLRKEDLLNMQQFNDFIHKFNRKQDIKENKKTWVWVILGIVVVVAGACALYKFLAPNDFEDDEMEDYEDFEDEDFDDLDYDDELLDEEAEAEIPIEEQEPLAEVDEPAE